MQVNVEIRDMQRAVDLLRCSINEKESAMKVAQTRLDERTRRLCVEVCFDEPMKGCVTVCVCLSVYLSLWSYTVVVCLPAALLSYFRHKRSSKRN